ncbi:ribonuclease E/G [Novosphingobium sp. PASSN1]|uniref:Rne/Rng family ribonuclease n=1 Tax=Novosphingobium sp. PASSN1 TaxID=2015561 RepID=UPI000BCFD94B|nr:ribonuclease E/G [Novosphingobium sp. PASSN1]OYU35855.1 MAG: ribonuclease E/G [Novosphingobium sp. PASSN1]
MTTRMLIDARHQEETRVAVLNGNRIEEFDFESADHKQIKGNIYLAKVTRVEPSLQAAFVDFGGNRHGFLAFSEIHPDYYMIPKEDREALLAEEAAHAEEEAALRAADEAEHGDLDDEEGGDDRYDYDGDEGVTEVDTSEKDEVATIEGGVVENGFEDESGDEQGEEGAEEGSEDGESRQRRPRRQRAPRAQAREADDLRARRMALRRRYKIQDVIQRRQVLLVQVVKEERGNKGAALTTYLSLAGRYCVLMPNSSHGGGISRKINSAADRKRLKSIMSELELPRTMSCIVRTAGLQRTKPEIKRDFDYLARLWDEIRERTLKSSAPALIHSDSDLIKRAIRDIYNRDIEEVVVEGEHGYRAAKDFMKLLMPSHAKRVRQYADPVPLFQRYGAEDQLTAMYDPVVQLKSGGYLVINPTEALVSIDINSGRSTKEHGIEATAVSTNLEAAREIARQLRLRDMAGLVVIDFIDMEYGSNVRKVEKAMKDALRNDRARIQVGRISGFGLMEMSRQRLRTGVLEATTRACPHCDGSGLVRTASSAGLSALRMIEDEAAKGKGTIITLYASQEAAIYVLNAKRADLAEIEERYGVTVEVIPEGENEGAKMRVGSRGPKPSFVPRFEPIMEPIDDSIDDEDYGDEDEAEAEDDDGTEDGARSERSREDGDGGRRKRRKRRRGRGRDRDDRDGSDRDDTSSAANEGDADDADGDERSEDGDRPEREEARDEPGDEGGEDRGPRKRRRRGRRRRGSRGDGEGQAGDDAQGEETLGEADGEDAAADAAEAPAATEPAVEAPAKPRRTRRRKADAEAVAADVAEAPAAEAVAEPVAEPAAAEAEVPAKPKRTRRKKADAAEAEVIEAPVAAEAPAAAAVAEAEAEAPAKPKRTRRKKSDSPETEAAPAAEAPAEEAAPAVAETPVADAAQAEETPGEPRRGWWQRTFGA